PCCQIPPRMPFLQKRQASTIRAPSRACLLMQADFTASFCEAAFTQFMTTQALWRRYWDKSMIGARSPVFGATPMGKDMVFCWRVASREILMYPERSIQEPMQSTIAVTSLDNTTMQTCFRTDSSFKTMCTQLWIFRMRQILPCLASTTTE